MKKGQIIAIVIAVGVVAAVYLADRTPSEQPQSVEVTTEETTNTQPENAASELDAKVDEAVEIIQSGSQPPMVAIKLLQEVVAADSNHIGANYWLGEFSMMSGQFDKAIQRYAKILTLQPDNVDACIKLARAQAAAGNSKDAQETLTQFLDSHPDENIKEQIAPVLEEINV